MKNTENKVSNSNIELVSILEEEILRKTFRLREEKKEFSLKYYLESKIDDTKGVLERYRLDEDYEVSILKASGKTAQGLFYPILNANVVEILYCFGGECKIYSKTDGKTYILKKGDILFYKINNESLENYSFESKDFKKILIFLNVDKLSKKILESDIDEEILSKWIDNLFSMFEDDIFCMGRSNSQINILVHQIENAKVNTLNEYFQFKSKIFQLIFLTLEIQAKFGEDVLQDDIEIVRKAKRIINGYPVYEIPSTKELCKIMMLSNYQLQRSFKNIYGITTSLYIQKIKMEYAKSLLETTNRNILDIAVEIGYENPSKFSIAFKKYYGILPNKYRKIQKK